MHVCLYTWSYNLLNFLSEDLQIGTCMWSYTPCRELVCHQRCRLHLLLFDPNTKALHGDCPLSSRFNNRRGACLVLFLYIKVVATKFGVTLELTQLTLGGSRFVLMRRHRLSRILPLIDWFQFLLVAMEKGKTHEMETLLVVACKMGNPRLLP